MSEGMRELIEELKKKYDYIILDTPPVGLVSDALELAQYGDVTLYIVRQNYTKKEMITLLNNRVKRGELNNASIILNGFENKAKYGAVMVTVMVTDMVMEHIQMDIMKRINQKVFMKN